MVGPERIGYLGRAQKALEFAGRLQDAETIGVMIKHGGDIFTYRSPRQALRELEASDELSERLNLVLSSFNISPKTATFLRAGAGTSTARSEIRDWFDEAYVDREEPRYATNHGYSLLKTLMQFGMLEVVPEDINRVRVTPFGHETGLPVAAKIASYESEEHESLYPAFGQIAVSNEDSPRAPLTRAKILLELMQAGQDPADFSKIHQIPKLIADSLRHLQRAGMVHISNEQAIHRGISRQYKILEITDRERLRDIKRRYEPVAEMVATACVALAQDGKRITANAVFSVFPEEYRNTHSEKSLMTDIHHFLQSFSTDIHFLEDISKSPTQEIIESARLTSEGQHLVTELLLPILDALQGGSILSEWREELLPRVQANLSRIARDGFALYAPYSTESLNKNREVLKEDIVEYIRELAPYAINPDGEYDFRVEDVSGLMWLNRAITNKFLGELVAEGRLQREYKRGGYYVYRVPEAMLE